MSDGAGAGNRPRIGLSSSSVYPESTAHAFTWAAEIGYEAVEVMVGIDALSQQADAVRQLSEHHAIPVSAVHAPCLLFTQRVWGVEPWGKLEKSAEMARVVGADVVVVHPPFRWQKEYARDFVEGVALREHETGIHLAVENMFPWRARQREFEAYLPHWDPVSQAYDHVTLDLSHTATAGSDAMEMARVLGPRLTHVHLADGLGSLKDEHLVPGRGLQPCAEFLEMLATRAYAGSVVVEVGTRKLLPAEREIDLAEALAFARLHLATASVAGAS
jgi:sugar phosphate isomerase/epimerase